MRQAASRLLFAGRQAQTGHTVCVRRRTVMTNPVAERKHARLLHDPRQLPPRHADQDHDLPLLAIELSARVRLPWESLMDSGIAPAVFLGAERRARGVR